MAYAPAGNTTQTGSLTHLATVYYDRRALTSLRTKFMFWKGCDERTLALKNGKTIQMYRYSQLGANTTPATEGDVGSSVTLTSTTVSATVSQYADFISLSDLLVDTAIDGDIVGVAADQLGYRAGLSVNRIIRAEVDSAAASINVPLLGTYMSTADVANIRARFAGADIPPFGDGYYRCLMHPYVVYDFVNDPQVGGYIDVVKQHPDMPGNERLWTYEASGFIGRWQGFNIWEATDLTVVPGSPNQYRTYFFASEGLGAIDLAGRGPTRTEDQNKQRFRVNVVRNLPVSVANPTGTIRALASYNFVFVAKILDTNPYRIRKIDAPTSLGL
mgnify:CR=1 FL=1